MNKDELRYIKENYFQSKRDHNSLDNLFDVISEVMESEKILKGHRVLREQLEGAALTMEVIPEVDVTELGWTDVRTVGDQAVSGPAREQLLQFTRNIQGSGLQEKIASLANFYNNPESINLQGASPGQRIANALSYLVFFKTLTKVISNFNAASAGFNFEAFLAVLLEGEQIKANTGTIADFTAGDNTPISLKLYSEKSLVVGGSFTDLVGDLVSPQFSPHDFMQYVVVLKSFEGESQGLDIKGELKFYRFNFTLDNVANIVLNSMGKSIKCIEMPQQMIQEFNAGNTDFDFNSTLPSQENLPSPEELEQDFIKMFGARMEALNYGVEQDEVNKFTQILDWAKNDQLFTPVPRGEAKLVVRGASDISERNAALRKAVEMSFGEAGFAAGQLQMIRRQVAQVTREINMQFTKKRLGSAREKVLRQPGVFADAQTSVDFYNSLTNPELKKKALLNSKGYLQVLQFDLNRTQVLNIEAGAGEYSPIPSGQGSVDIGTIMIGTEYVQEVLNRMTEELNQSIFSIFQNVKMIKEGTYAFMAGGLEDDSQAEKAISASKDVEGKVQDLRPGQDEQAKLDL
jgi:hypothetical protein